MPPEKPPGTAGGGGTGPRQLPFRHDGFYLRAALGVGLIHDRFRGDLPGYAFARDQGRLGSLTAFSAGSELALGGCLEDGLVLGVGLFTVLAPDPWADSTVGDWYGFDLEQLALVAPHVDFYPWPNRGWHAQAAFGAAALSVGDAASPDGAARPVEDHVALGPGFLVGAGHEWWIGERWSFGGTVRWIHGWGAGTGFDGGRFVHRADGLVALLGFTLN
jgi:hypothetical protein